MYYFIVNPSSRSGRGRKVWQQVEVELERLSVEYRVFFTSGQGHAIKLSREITSRDGSHTLVALGGDGTVNEVINGIQDFDRVTFAYIPTGSSNDFARSLKLPGEPLEALANILHPKYYRRIDLGRMEYGNRQRLFAVSCGMGFDAAVCYEALHSKMKRLLNRIKLGKLTYVGIALRQMILLKGHAISMTAEGSGKRMFPKTFFVSVMNCAYEGGGLKMCPQAQPLYGRLDTCVVESVNKLFLSLVLPTAFFGKHTHFWCVHMNRGPVIRLKAQTPLPVHADGEFCKYHRELVISCLPGRLKIIAGKEEI